MENERTARWAVGGLALAALALLALVYGIDLDHAFGDGDEAIYGELVRSMHRSSNYFRLEYLGAELLQRPPTSVALYAAVARLVPGEFGVRLLPALFSLLTYVGIGVFVWRRSGRLAAGVVAMLVGATIPTVWTYGRVAFSDPPFVAAVTAALLATIAAQRDARWLPWAGAGLGAAVAVKSLAAAVPIVALAPWLVAASWRHRTRRRQWISAVVVFLVLAVPYFVIGLAVHGERFYREHLERILVERAAGELESVIGLGGPSAYLRHLWIADGPIMAVVILVAVVAAGMLAWRRRSPELAIATSYSVLVFVFLSAIGTRLGHYLLVFYPGVALCLGLVTASVLESARDRGALAASLAAATALAAVALNLGRAPIDGSLLPSTTSLSLGRAAAARMPADANVYSLDWYAPALGYYADRPWHLLVTRPRLARALANIDPFVYTGTVAAVPPFPRGELYLAAPAAALDAAGLEVLEELAAHEGYVLVRARAADPGGVEP